MEDVIANVTSDEILEEKIRNKTTKASKGSMPLELWNYYINHKDSETKFPIQIEGIVAWCNSNRVCYRCYREDCLKRFKKSRHNPRTNQRAIIQCLRQSLAEILTQSVNRTNHSPEKTISPCLTPIFTPNILLLAFFAPYTVQGVFLGAVPHSSFLDSTDEAFLPPTFYISPGVSTNQHVL